MLNFTSVVPWRELLFEKKSLVAKAFDNDFSPFDYLEVKIDGTDTKR